MTNLTNQNLTDELLQRFLDGELAEDDYREVQDLINSDDEASLRFEQLRQLNDLVAGYNRSVLSEPVPDWLMPSARSRLVGDLYRIAASVLLIGLGVLLGWVIRSPNEASVSTMLVDQAAAAHALYTQEVLHTVEVPAQRSEHLAKWLSKRLGVEVKIPKLTKFGYEFLGGRVLPGDGPSAHAMLVYQRSDGKRISVYMIRSKQPEHTNTLYTEKDRMSVFYWRDHELSCAVVANLDSTTDLKFLRKLSDSVYEQVEL